MNKQFTNVVKPRDQFLLHINTAEFVAPGGQELRGAAAGGVPVGQLAQKCLERGRRIGSLALGAPAKDLVDGREVLRPGGALLRARDQQYQRGAAAPRRLRPVRGTLPALLWEERHGDGVRRLFRPLGITFLGEFDHEVDGVEAVATIGVLGVEQQHIVAAPLQLGPGDLDELVFYVRDGDGDRLGAVGPVTIGEQVDGRNEAEARLTRPRGAVEQQVALRLE